MSYFPPPPPAPPPARNYFASNYGAKSHNSRGRSNEGHRGKGVQLRDFNNQRARGGYSRISGGIGTSICHSNGNHSPSNLQSIGYGGSFNQFLGAYHTVSARPSFQQPPLSKNPRDGSQRALDNPPSQRKDLVDLYDLVQQRANGCRPPTFHRQYQAGNSQQRAGRVAYSASTPDQLALHGPPIRIGYDPWRGGLHSSVYEPDQNIRQHPQTDLSGNVYKWDGLNVLPQTFHGSNNELPASRDRGQMRGYGEVFGQKERNQGFPRPQAPPAVPSFVGPLPLPAKPPAPQGEKKRPEKHKRNQNKLGLTPKVEERDFSEEQDDDEDEEAKLVVKANGMNGPSQLQPLQINYRGRTSTLRSSADIIAWVEERKKRFPTKARAAEAAERRRQREEAQRAAKQTQMEVRTRKISQTRVKQRHRVDDDVERKKIKEIGGTNRAHNEQGDEAVRAKRKVEKLRRQLKKEEKRIVEAEAKASLGEDASRSKNDFQDYSTDHDANSKKRKRSPSPNSLEHVPSQILASADEDFMDFSDLVVQAEACPATTVPDTSTPTSQSPDPSEMPDSLRDPSAVSVAMEEGAIGPDNVKGDRASVLSETLSSDLTSGTLSTDREDVTSSSGSDSSDSENAPEEATSKRDGPESAPPPKRETSKKICKFYLQKGRCRLGASCKFKHELPERGSNVAKAKEAMAVGKASQPEGRRERMSLYQRLVQQEKKNEEETVLRAIIHLGETGVLDQAVEEAPGSPENTNT